MEKMGPTKMVVMGVASGKPGQGSGAMCPWNSSLQTSLFLRLLKETEELGFSLKSTKP